MYPVLAAAVGDHAAAAQRGAAIGIFRGCRDLGYAAGALIALLADVASPEAAVLCTAAVAAAAAVAVVMVYEEAPVV